MGHRVAGRRAGKAGWEALSKNRTEKTILHVTPSDAVRRAGEGDSLVQVVLGISEVPEARRPVHALRELED